MHFTLYTIGAGAEVPCGSTGLLTFCACVFGTPNFSSSEFTLTDPAWTLLEPQILDAGHTPVTHTAPVIHCCLQKSSHIHRTISATVIIIIILSQMTYHISQFIIMSCAWTSSAIYLKQHTKWHTFYSITITSSPWTAMLSWQPITYKPIKLGQTDLVWVCNRSSSVGLCMQGYKSLCVAVMICATLGPDFQKILGKILSFS